jgi:NAD(P)-dependent dehydrogenase (short-subunit alcohol dehydrogenase family)
MKTALVIGGTSGLGLELARLYKPEFDVIVTGSGKHTPPELDVRVLDLGANANLAQTIETFVKSLPNIQLMIYAAGAALIGSITQMSDEDMQSAANINLLGPMILTNELLKKQGSLYRAVYITSTSQFTPRAKEPVYTAFKSGLGMFAKSLSQDGHVERVLVAAPGGMKTAFWDGLEVDTSNYLDAVSVATIIQSHAAQHYSYRLVTIPRTTGTAEILEQTSQKHTG